MSFGRSAFATPFVLKPSVYQFGTSLQSSARWTPTQPLRKKRAAMSTSISAQAPDFSKGPTLLAKAGPNGELGDCPFTQKANMALRARGCSFDVVPVSLSEKPDWFLALNPKGSTPTYVNGSKVIASSDEIVELADDIGTNGAALYDVDNPHWDKAFDVVAALFPAFAKFMKNQDPAEEAALKQALDDAVSALNLHLRQVEGRFLVSDNLSALDCNLAPKLHAVLVAGNHFKKYKVPWNCSVLIQYITDVYELDEWKQSACSNETVIWGWSKFFAPKVAA